MGKEKEKKKEITGSISQSAISAVSTFKVECTKGRVNKHAKKFRRFVFL